MGLFLEFYLNILDIDVVIFIGDPRTLDLLHKFGPEDVIIAISFARYSRFTVECLRFAAKKGARVFLYNMECKKTYPSGMSAFCTIIQTPKPESRALTLGPLVF